MRKLGAYTQAEGAYVFPAVVGAADPVLPVIVTFGLMQL
jgi:hypothetical protein